MLCGCRFGGAGGRCRLHRHLAGAAPGCLAEGRSGQRLVQSTGGTPVVAAATRPGARPDEAGSGWAAVAERGSDGCGEPQGWQLRLADFRSCRTVGDRGLGRPHQRIDGAAGPPAPVRTAPIRPDRHGGCDRSGHLQRRAAHPSTTPSSSRQWCEEVLKPAVVVLSTHRSPDRRPQAERRPAAGGSCCEPPAITAGRSRRGTHRPGCSPDAGATWCKTLREETASAPVDATSATAHLGAVHADSCARAPA